MRRIFSLFVIVAAIALACTSSAKAQTYNWTPIANGHNIDGRADGRHQTLALTVPANITKINIVSSRLIAAGMVNYDYTVTSGPSPVVGEVVEACCGVPNGMFKVLSLQTDPNNGSLQMTVAENTDDAYPNSGPAQVGPPLVYNLYFIGRLSDDYGHPLPGATCDPSQSSLTAYFLDASGNLQSVTSASGSVSCGPNTTTGTIYTGIKLYTKGQFTGVGTDGNTYTVPFEVVNQGNSRTALFYAQSVTWTVNGGSAQFKPETCWWDGKGADWKNIRCSSRTMQVILSDQLNVCTDDGKVWWRQRQDGMCHAADRPRVQ